MAMLRREFIAGLFVATAFSRAQAQRSAKVYRIAKIYAAAPVAEAIKFNTIQGSIGLVFFEELRRLGLVEGQNFVYERYSAEGRNQFSELARQVVRSNPDVIVADSTKLALEIRAATTTIPIVAITGDPVAAGIVPSLARPGGNITGTSVNAGPEISGKYVELLKEAIPGVSRAGFLASRETWQTLAEGEAMQEAARRLQISLIGPPTDFPIDEVEYRRVITAMEQTGAQALIVGQSAQNVQNVRLIIELAEKARLPTILAFRPGFELGGLIAFAMDEFEMARQQANQIAQILKGANPGDIPIYQPTKFDPLINLRTAKALGIELPGSLVARANEVIEWEGGVSA
jgi:putative ABC transport system substrate-binding protein